MEKTTESSKYDGSLIIEMNFMLQYSLRERVEIAFTLMVMVQFVNDRAQNDKLQTEKLVNGGILVGDRLVQFLFLPLEDYMLACIGKCVLLF